MEEENEIAAAKKERDKEFEKFYSQISSMSSLSDAESAWTELLTGEGLLLMLQKLFQPVCTLEVDASPRHTATRHQFAQLGVVGPRAVFGRRIQVGPAGVERRRS